MKVYQIPLGGMIVRQNVGASGSGSTYVYGYLDHNFKEGMKQDECEEFVKKGGWADFFMNIFSVIKYIVCFFNNYISCGLGYFS